LHDAYWLRMSLIWSIRLFFAMAADFWFPAA
jgi:hypothetical protein